MNATHGRACGTCCGEAHLSASSGALLRIGATVERTAHCAAGSYVTCIDLTIRYSRATPSTYYFVRTGSYSDSVAVVYIAHIAEHLRGSGAAGGARRRALRRRRRAARPRRPPAPPAARARRAPAAPPAPPPPPRPRPGLRAGPFTHTRLATSD